MNCVCMGAGERGEQGVVFGVMGEDRDEQRSKIMLHGRVRTWNEDQPVFSKYRCGPYTNRTTFKMFTASTHSGQYSCSAVVTYF